MKKEISKKVRAKPLALHIGVGLSTIWRWAKQGKIKPYKISTGVTVFDKYCACCIITSISDSIS